MGRRQKFRRAWSLALCLSLGTAPPLVPIARATPDVDAATERYKAGLSLMKSGDHVGAAEAFAEAFDLVPTSQREVRAGVLFDLVQARRKAATGDDETPVSSSRHLCGARAKLTMYLGDITQQYGEKAAKFRDTRKAKKLLKTVEQEIVDAGEIIPEACATLDEQQAPTPDSTDPQDASQAPQSTEVEENSKTAPTKPGRPLVIAGAATLGSSSIFWGMLIGGLAIGNRADSDGNLYVDAGISAGAPVSQTDPTLLEIEARGRRGNRLAIAGGVLATAISATGAALLIIGLRRNGRSKQVAWVPVWGTKQVGVGLAGRF